MAMKSKVPALLVLVMGLAVLFSAPVQAQQHRATRLGDPSGRFAPPLSQPEDLRARFRDPKLKPDIAEILRQVRWTGDAADLHQAAQNAEISDLKFPVGTRMPYMSSRRNGKPVALIDVLWAGKEPFEAYVFNFSSKGVRYRCVTPKACSNFYLEELGPDSPKLQLFKSAPFQGNLCEPMEIKLVVRNVGGVPATQVTVTDSLPAGIKTTDNQTVVRFDAGTLQPGESREFKFPVVATTSGTFGNVARATCAEGLTANAIASTQVRSPMLTLECSAPPMVPAGRPVRVCLTVRNTGDAPESKATITLPIPAGATVESTTGGGVVSGEVVTWEIANLAPQASVEMCAVLVSRQFGPLSLSPTARGACLPPVSSQCGVRIGGIAGILLEVVDLEDPVEVGKEVTYEIRVLNQGATIGTNVRLVCRLPDSLEYVSGAGLTPVKFLDGTITIEPLPSLGSKISASWRVVAKALKEDDARFKVELFSEQYDQPIHEDESTTLY